MLSASIGFRSFRAGANLETREPSRARWREEEGDMFPLVQHFMTNYYPSEDDK
jgi:hypothetical protein